MPYARIACLTLLLAIAPPVSIHAGSDPARMDAGILRVEEHASRAVALPPRATGAGQRLARIDGALYQKSGELYLPVVPDRISVRLADDVKSWDELVARTVARDPKAYAPLADLVAERTNRLGVVDLRVPEGSDLIPWLDLLETTGEVRYAEVASRGVYLATQSDPLYPQQYALNNTGQTGGTPGADVDAERAWDLTAGDPSVIVAVLDSGTAIDHEDLAANVWHNDGEIPGNGIDDDGNGFVDDWEGWDFAGNDNDPRSGNEHGTFVTGIVNAAGSNGAGVAGLAGGLGGPGVRAMILSVGSSGPVTDVIDDAILYAADRGARVITLSLSVGETQAINDALDYAYNLRDVFVDCAAGNSGSAVSYPALRPEVMAVGSTDHDDLSSGFSNPGPEVEVSAPGSSVLSTALNNGYTTSSGTSFAAPRVAALAALIYSRNPGLAAADVRQIIIDTAEDVGDPGFDERTGHGRINAYEALLIAADSDGVIRLDRAAYACDATVGLTVSDVDLAGSGTIDVTASSETEPAGETVTLTETGAGSGLFRGALAADGGAAQPDGRLQLSDGDTLVAEYVDQDDGSGGTGVTKTATSTADCRAPLVADVAVDGVTTSTATIHWTTDEAADTRVRYGDDLPPSQLEQSAGFVYQHQVALSGLDQCTIYKFAVESSDDVGNLGIDDNDGTYFVFETLVQVPGVGAVPCHQALLAFDDASPAGCEEGVGLSLLDSDLDTDSGQVESVQVRLASTREPEGEWVTLTEINPQSSRFEGQGMLDRGPPVAGDGLLAVADGDFVTATYHDPDDGQGRPWIATASKTADCEAPRIGDVRVTEIAATRAVIEWTTDEPGTSRVEFGPTAALGNSVEDPTLRTDHRVVISVFDACERVHFRVSSVDTHGETRVADAAGVPFSFNVNEIPGLVFHETFETDTGWTLPDDWERGTPQGLGSGAGDPTAAWSGLSVIGNDLSGLGAFAGDYEPVTSSSALSPVFSTRQQRGLELIVHRKLGVTSTDEAGIYVVTSGADQVWTSNYQVMDDDWFVHSRDISAWADNKNAVQIEFRIESSDPGTSFGWNIDEVIVKDRALPDYQACGGCAGAPTFAGLETVSDPDACAGTGLVLAWQAAPGWGTGVSGSFEVHRGLTPDFAPGAANRVATGLTGTSWTDANVPPDTPVWYVVRARNDESCTADGGLTDANTVRVGAVDSTAQSLPGPVGATLSIGTLGGVHTRLEWPPATGASTYSVLRATQADFSDAAEVGTTAGTLFEDPGAVTAPTSYYYRVVAVDACGRSE
ncbi:MAG TPA: S8 family serine peptidase [Candidatus Polarisedimenticolaceae bacterium]|nr:S8 family serine peptidase [Candidatus Polarisedimenticolaceae bacterium]